MRSVLERQAEQDRQARARLAAEDQQEDEGLRMPCCGAPTVMEVPSGRWRQRHYRAGSRLCQAARACALRYERERYAGKPMGWRRARWERTSEETRERNRRREAERRQNFTAEQKAARQLYDRLKYRARVEAGWNDQRRRDYAERQKERAGG